MSNKQAITELKEVLDLLQQEKEEEIRQYDELLNKTPLNERVKKGAAWYPLQVESWGWGLGEHPYVVVERQKQRDEPHKFRGGAVVTIFNNEEGTKNQLEERGVVHWVKKNQMKVILYGTELPSWVTKNRIGVQLSFDERSFEQMEKAVRQVMEAKSDRLAELRQILLGYEKPSFREHEYKYDVPKLNRSQNLAMQQALYAEDIAVIHGPPGTGKTTTLVETIVQLAKKETPILVCAPSNPATDLLTERLAEAKLNVVRIGNLSRIDEKLIESTIEGILKNHPAMQEVKRMKIEAAHLRRNAEKFRRKFGQKEREERRTAYRDARDLIQHAKMLEDYVIEKILKEADVITCTLVSSMNRYIEKMNFGTVIIDEAAQALEPATWIPITKAKRVVLAGDPYQLPPTVKNNKAAQAGLSVTLLEKCVERIKDVQLLNIQYRMNAKIMEFSNQQFYNGALQAAEFVANWQLEPEEDDGKVAVPVEFIDTAGCGFDEKLNPETRSRYNHDEYSILRQHLDHLLTLSGENKPSIAIISPYKEQVIHMQEKYPDDFDHYPEADVVIDTIDAFQGQERDVVYISMVRSNENSEIGFLKDTRRMNVAMTRARKKLIIIGDSATIGNFPFYGAFLDYCDKLGAYSTAWEWM